LTENEALNKKQLDKVSGGLTGCGLGLCLNFSNQNLVPPLITFEANGAQEYYVRLHNTDDNTYSDWMGPYPDKASATNGASEFFTTKPGTYEIEYYPED